MTQQDVTPPITAPAIDECSKWQSMKRGFKHKCPACGTGPLYQSYLKVADNCAHCGEELHHRRADDAPPYFVMLIVGYVLVGAALSIEQYASPPTWFYAVTFGPLTLLLVLLLLPRVKGVLVGLQWALGMHGFDRDFVEVDDGGFGRWIKATGRPVCRLMKPYPLPWAIRPHDKI